MVIEKAVMLWPSISFSTAEILNILAKYATFRATIQRARSWLNTGSLTKGGSEDSL